MLRDKLGARVRRRRRARNSANILSSDTSLAEVPGCTHALERGDRVEDTRQRHRPHARAVCIFQPFFLVFDLIRIILVF